MVSSSAAPSFTELVETFGEPSHRLRTARKPQDDIIFHFRVTCNLIVFQTLLIELIFQFLLFGLLFFHMDTKIFNGLPHFFQLPCHLSQYIFYLSIPITNVPA